MNIEWTEEAATELDDLLGYISDQDSAAAALVAGRVLKAEQTILTFPRAARHDTETDTYDISIPKTRIILTYVLRDDAIWIVSVWHTSRDPDTKQGRKP